jgi:hypothetical protein
MYPFQDLTHRIIASAIEVHKSLGLGLLESVYLLCLQLEFDHILTYLKLADKQIGLLINFNVPLLKNGIRRCILTHKKAVYTESEK